MATSTIVAFKAALIASLQGRANLDGVSVTWGIPPTEPEPEWIFVGDVKGPAEQEAAALGRQRREEKYALEIIVSVTRQFADDAQECAERAVELAAEIEDELRTDVEQGVVRVAQVVGLGLEEGADGNERWAVVPMRVDVRQRV